MTFDPQKLAAVFYDDETDVDVLLRTFADSLLQRGLRVGGVLQRPRARSGPKVPLALEDVCTREVLPICQDLGKLSEGCAFDPNLLAAGRARVRHAIDAHVDLVLVSRFGREESTGGGFLPELAHAVMSGVPALTCVRRGPLRDHWLAFTDGVGPLLEARLPALDAWWRAR